MRIGFLGAGVIAQALATHFVAAGHDVGLSNRRGTTVLAPILRRLGDRASWAPADQAATEPVVFLAVRFEDAAPLLRGLGGWDGRILVDTTNSGYPIGDRNSSAEFQEIAREARVVKSGNTFLPRTLAADPREDGGHRVQFLAGDDPSAKEVVGDLWLSTGFAAVDLGDLVSGGHLIQFPAGPLPALNLVWKPSPEEGIARALRRPKS